MTDNTAAPTDKKGSARAAAKPTGPGGQERRSGPKDRRVASVDRRNEDRVAEELLPRRNPDQPDRRVAALSADLAHAAQR